MKLLYEAEFTLRGTSPLLFHADDVEQSDALSEWRKDPANKNLSVPGDDRSPPWTWTTYLYTDGEKLVWPSDNLMVALRQAGASLILKRMKTYKEITQNGLIIPAEFCEFEGKKGPISYESISKMRDLPFVKQAELVQNYDYRLFVKRARVGQAKHVRVRARFNEWTIRGIVQVVTPDIKLETLEQLFELAGRGGLGDWRPACKTPGRFGMFSASLKLLKGRKEVA